MSLRTISAFAAVVLIWSTSWYLITLQLGAVHPSWSVSYRFALGGAVLLAWTLLRGQDIRLPVSALPFLLALGLFQFVLNFNFVYRAELYIASGLVAVAFALLIIPNAILARIVLGRRVSRRFALGAALGMAGVLLLFSEDLAASGAGSATLTGLALTALGVLSASVANIMQASAAARRLPLLPAIGWAMLLGAGGNALFAWAVAGPPTFEPTPAYVASLAGLGILASAVAFALYFDLIRTMGPAEAAWTGVPIPILAMLISTAFEGYVWTPAALAGAALALAGLVLALAQPRRAAAQA